VLDVSRLAREQGLYTVYVSNSFVTAESLEEMAPWVDVLCSDIKSLDDAFYRDICPVAGVEQVLASIRRAHELGIHVETRTKIIPGRNDDSDMLRGIARWIRDNLGVGSPWHITRFFPAYKLAHLPPTPVEDLWRARDLALAAGLQNVYVYDDKGCDCAQENRPIDQWLNQDPTALGGVKKCSADCCGDEGVLLKKYERA